MWWRGVDIGSRHSHGNEQSCLSWAEEPRQATCSPRAGPGFYCMCPLEKPGIKTWAANYGCSQPASIIMAMTLWVLLDDFMLSSGRKSTINLSMLGKNCTSFASVLLFQDSFAPLYRSTPSAVLSALLVHPNAPPPRH